MTHAHTRQALPFGIPAATLAPVTPSALTARGRHARPSRAGRAALVALAVPVLLAAGTGVASADANPASTAAHACFTHRDLPGCAEPVDSETQALVDGAQVVRTLGFWDRLRIAESRLLHLF